MLGGKVVQKSYKYKAEISEGQPRTYHLSAQIHCTQPFQIKACLHFYLLSYAFKASKNTRVINILIFTLSTYERVNLPGKTNFYLFYVILYHLFKKEISFAH